MIHEMFRRLRNRDELRFFLHWLRRPGRLGAVVPSGPALAAALAAEIDTEAPGAVVELGSGTGRETGVQCTRAPGSKHHVLRADSLDPAPPGLPSTDRASPPSADHPV